MLKTIIIIIAYWVITHQIISDCLNLARYFYTRYVHILEQTKQDSILFRDVGELDTLRQSSTQIASIKTNLGIAMYTFAVQRSWGSCFKMLKEEPFSNTYMYVIIADCNLNCAWLLVNCGYCWCIPYGANTYIKGPNKMNSHVTVESPNPFPLNLSRRFLTLQIIIRRHHIPLIGQSRMNHTNWHKN